MYKKTPDYTREGGSIPVTLTFADALGQSLASGGYFVLFDILPFVGVNVLLLPMGRGDDGAQ